MDYKERARERFNEFKQEYDYRKQDEFRLEQKFLLEEELRTIPIAETRRRLDVVRLLNDMEGKVQGVSLKSIKKDFIIYIDANADDCMFYYNCKAKRVFGDVNKRVNALNNIIQEIKDENRMAEIEVCIAYPKSYPSVVLKDALTVKNVKCMSIEESESLGSIRTFDKYNIINAEMKSE